MTGSLQYVVIEADVMSVAFDEELIFSCKDLDLLLDPRLLISYAFRICKQRGQAFCEHVFGAWVLAMRSLPHTEVNHVGSHFSGKTFLTRCLALLHAVDRDAEDIMRDEYRGAAVRFHLDVSDFHDKRWPGEPFEDFLHEIFAGLIIELVREKMDVGTVEKTFLFHKCETDKINLWKLVRGEKYPYRNRPSGCSGGLRFGLGADLMIALIDKGLPRWCWAGCLGPFNDNLLQHIIEPATIGAAMDGKDAAKGRLCIYLAQKLRVEELCHRNQDGRSALSYAEEFAEHFESRPFQWRPPWMLQRPDQAVWIQVRDVIRQEMEARVRAFQGDLPALVELTRSVRAGLDGDLAVCTEAFADCVSSF